MLFAYNLIHVTCVTIKMLRSNSRACDAHVRMCAHLTQPLWTQILTFYMRNVQPLWTQILTFYMCNVHIHIRYFNMLFWHGYDVFDVCSYQFYSMGGKLLCCVVLLVNIPSTLCAYLECCARILSHAKQMHILVRQVCLSHRRYVPNVPILHTILQSYCTLCTLWFMTHGHRLLWCQQTPRTDVGHLSTGRHSMPSLQAIWHSRFRSALQECVRKHIIVSICIKYLAS